MNHLVNTMKRTSAVTIKLAVFGSGAMGQWLKDMVPNGSPGVEPFAGDERANPSTQGKVAVLPHPDSALTVPPVDDWILCINRHSDRNEAVWDFIRWVSSPDIHKEPVLAGGPPSRHSTTQTEEIVAAQPRIATLYESANHVRLYDAKLSRLDRRFCGALEIDQTLLTGPPFQKLLQSTAVLTVSSIALELLSGVMRTMVFLFRALSPSFRVRAKTGIGPRITGLPKTEGDSKVAVASGTLGMGEVLDHKTQEFTIGQQQRTAVGGAIVRNPSVFQFNGSLFNLDAALPVQMCVELVRLHERLATTMTMSPTTWSRR